MKPDLRYALALRDPASARTASARSWHGVVRFSPQAPSYPPPGDLPRPVSLFVGRVS